MDDSSFARHRRVRINALRSGQCSSRHEHLYAIAGERRWLRDNVSERRVRLLAPESYAESSPNPAQFVLLSRYRHVGNQKSRVSGSPECFLDLLHLIHLTSVEYSSPSA